MSKATKRKHVTKEVQEDLRIPKDEQSIVRLIDSRGNNLHEVEDRLGERYLVSMPMKFRRNVWVKRGNFVLVEPIAEGDKVKAEIVTILTKDHIKFYRGQNCWPEEFDKKEDIEKSTTTRSKELDENESSDDDQDGDLFVNTNRHQNLNGSHANESTTESSDSD